jgi:hypothetical protein
MNAEVLALRAALAVQAAEKNQPEQLRQVCLDVAEMMEQTPGTARTVFDALLESAALHSASVELQHGEDAESVMRRALADALVRSEGADGAAQRG